MKVSVFAAAPCACAATVYFVPEYGFFADVHFVLASLKVPASVEPSLPVTFTAASVPSATVTVTGAVKSAFFVPSAGVTVTVGAFAAFTDAVTDEPPDGEPSAAPAELLQPVRTAAGDHPEHGEDPTTGPPLRLLLGPVGYVRHAHGEPSSACRAHPLAVRDEITSAVASCVTSLG